MHRFFEILDNAGIRQSRMAKLMDVSEGNLSRVRTGSLPASRRFRQRAADALATTGIRRADGETYSPNDLFLVDQQFNQLNETDTEVNETAELAEAVS